MEEVNHPIQPTNSANISPFTRVLNEPYPSSTASAPTGIKKYYSNDVFKTVTFFILVVSILATSTVAFFAGKLSADQQLGIYSSLLFLCSPSPIQRKKGKKKVVYQTVTSSAV